MKFSFLNRYCIHSRVEFGFSRRRKSTSAFIIRFQSNETTVMWLASAWSSLPLIGHIQVCFQF